MKALMIYFSFILKYLESSAFFNGKRKHLLNYSSRGYLFFSAANSGSPQVVWKCEDTSLKYATTRE